MRELEIDVEKVSEEILIARGMFPDMYSFLYISEKKNWELRVLPPLVTTPEKYPPIVSGETGENIYQDMILNITKEFLNHILHNDEVLVAELDDSLIGEEIVRVRFSNNETRTPLHEAKISKIEEQLSLVLITYENGLTEEYYPYDILQIKDLDRGFDDDGIVED